MGAAEVEGIEGVGQGVMSLLRLWKDVEKCSGGLLNAPIPQQ
jgi:hypothetical protein